MRVLIVEDDYDLAQGLACGLGREGYEVVVAHDGQEGLRKAQMLLPGVILLDLVLPVLSGEEVLRALRAGEATRHIPVLILTARAGEADQVAAFGLGADDYITKPFSLRVLLQRLETWRRRPAPAGQASPVVAHLGVRLDRGRHRVEVRGRGVDLTPTEFRLLECLLRAPGRIFSRAELMDAAIGQGAVVLEGTITVHIKALRQKLGEPDLIETVRGAGYRFRETT